MAKFIMAQNRERMVNVEACKSIGFTMSGGGKWAVDCVTSGGAMVLGYYGDTDNMEAKDVVSMILYRLEDLIRSDTKDPIAMPESESEKVWEFCFGENGNE